MDTGGNGTIRSNRAAGRRLRRLAAGALLLWSAAIAPLHAQSSPGLSIADLYLAEGDAGTTSFEFRVALDAPAPAGGVRFDIATADGGAVAGADYSASATTLEIPEGAVEVVHTVLVQGDADYEPDETFFVAISNATGAGIVDGQAVGTILNDEPTPRLLVADRSVIEGDIGDTTVRIEVALDIPTTVEVRVDYETREGSATADEDYASTSGTLVFAPGDTLRHIDLVVHGDTLDERSEDIELFLHPSLDQMNERFAQIVIVTDDDGVYNFQPATLPDGTLGERYDQGFFLDGAPGARFAITAGALPPDIEMILSPFNGRNYLVGTPVTMGTYRFEVTAFADATLERPLARRSYTIVIGGQPLTLPPTVFPSAAFGEPYDVALNPATGALPPYRYALAGGALPPGLALTESGRIVGESSGSGTFAFTVTASDSSPTGAQTASRDYTLQALPPTIAIEPPFHPLDGSEGQDYSVQFGVRGIGTEPYTFSVTGGALPPGLALTASGEIAGIPTQSGDFTFTLGLADSTASVPASASAEFTIRIASSPLSFGPATLPDARTDATYEQRFVATGASQWSLFQVRGGALPPGLDLYDDTLAGTPTEAGTYTFEIMATDALANSYTRRYTLVVTTSPLVVDPVASPPATAGRPFSQQLNARGGVRPYRFEIVGGTLPPGTSMNADGFISGTPTASGSFHVRVAATDSGSTPTTARQDVNIAVALPTVTIFTDRLEAAAVGANYVVRLTAYGGQPPYVFALADGALPAGLELRPEGNIIGIPQTAGSFFVAIAATDSSAPFGPIVGRREFTLVVEPPRLGLSPVVLPVAREDIAYSARVVAANGVAPYRFELTAGALPPGLTLSLDGAVVGVPTRGANAVTDKYVFTLGVTDATGRTALQLYEIDTMWRIATIAIAPDTVPAGAVGVAYETRFEATTTRPPVALAWEEGALPRGLRFDAQTATLAGIPLDAGTFVFRLRATDAAHTDVVRQYTLTIAAPTLTLAPATLADGRVGASYAAAFSAGGGIAPYRFSPSENGGPLPPGLTLTEDGRIEGVPTSAGAYAFAIVVLDSSGPTPASLERAFTLNIAAAQAAQATPPEAMARTLDAFAGATTVVDLTEGARGGPFTAATLVSLTPADAGTARIEGGEGRYRLHFVASPAFAGRVEATFALANANATSSPTRIVFVVAQRPDPTRDAQVSRLLDAQTRIARRFADAQIGNFRQRLERLHDGRDPAGFQNGLRANAALRCEPQVGDLPGRPCVRPASSFARTRDPRVAPAARPLFGLWATGTVRSANHDGRDPGGSSFETDGVSFGADYRVGASLAFGLGVGYGRDGGALGDDDATATERLRSDGEATTLAVYASLRPGERAFVDLLYGEQSLVFDLRRAGGVSGRRDGVQRFASIAAGAEFAHGDWRVSPYARIDASSARLAAYAESGPTPRALAYEALRVDHLAANAGLRVDVRRETTWGAFAPQLRMEYRRDLDGDGAQRLRYADTIAGTDYADAIDGFGRERLRLDLTLRFETRRAWSFGLDTRIDAGGDGQRDAGVELRVQKRF
ncbi:MAG: putative Ig domain-containing protein [Pseudomonadota bacterium]